MLFLLLFLQVLAVPVKASESAAAAPSPVIEPRSERLEVLQKEQRNLEARVKRSGSFPAPLRLRFAVDHVLDYDMPISFNALNDCLTYLETPAKEHTPQSKAEALKNIFSNGLDEEKRPFLARALEHPICHDAFKTLGEALTLNNCKWLAKYAPRVLQKNAELFVSLKDYSWMTVEFIQSMLDPFVKHLINPLKITRLVETAPVDVLAELLYRRFDPSYVDVLQERLLRTPEAAKHLSLYLVLPYLPAEKRIIPPGYEFDATLLVKDLKEKGLTRMNLPVMMAFAQVTDSIIFHNLDKIAQAWLEANLNAQFVTETPFSVRLALFEEKVEPVLDLILTVRDQRAALWDTFDSLNEIDSCITDAIPEVRRKLTNLLRNPVHPWMRLSLFNLSNVFIFPHIHPEDVNALIPLPRMSQAMSFEKVRQQDAASIFLWNSLLRNVFFTTGESCRARIPFEQGPAAVAEFFRDEFTFFIYNHSGLELLVSDAQLLEERFELFSFACNYSDIELPLKAYVIESAASFPPLENRPPGWLVEMDSIWDKYEEVLLRIIPILSSKLFCESDFDHLRVKFMNRPKLLEALENLESTKHVLEATADHAAPFRHSPVLNKVVGTILAALQAAKNALPSGDVKRAQVALNNYHLFLKVGELAFRGFGPILTPEIIAKIEGNSPLMQLLNIHGRLLSSTQVGSLLLSDAGLEFLKQNKGMATTLIDYSAFSSDILRKLELSIADIKINTATLPASAKMLLLSTGSFIKFDDPYALAVNLGRNFWSSSSVCTNTRAWELLQPIYLLAMDPTWTDRARVFYEVHSVVPKLVGHQNLINLTANYHVRLEASISTIIKWIIQQEWAFLQYHVLLQAFAGDKIHRKRLTTGYSQYLAMEAVARQEISKWIDEILPCLQRPEIISALQLIRDHIHKPVSQLRVDHIFSVIRERNMSNGMIKTEAGYFKACNPYATLGELQTVFTNALPVAEDVIGQYRALLKKYDTDNAWQVKLTAVLQFSKAAVSGTVMSAYQILHALPTFDALIYKMALEMMGVNFAEIMGKRVPFFEAGAAKVMSQAADKPKYALPFESGDNERLYELATPEEIAVFESFLNQAAAPTSKSSTRNKKKK